MCHQIFSISYWNGSKREKNKYTKRWGVGVLQDDGEELSDLEYGDLSEDEEALISEGVDHDLDLAEQR